LYYNQVPENKLKKSIKKLGNVIYYMYLCFVDGIDSILLDKPTTKKVKEKFGSFDFFSYL